MINPENGLRYKEYFLAPIEAEDKRDFIIISLTNARAQFILAITDSALRNGQPLVAYPTEQFSAALMEGENIYFTHVDQAKGVLTGYKLRRDLVAVQVWSLNLDKQGEKILKLETQF